MTKTKDPRQLVQVRLSTIPRNAACCQGMKDNEPFAFNSETGKEVEIKFCPFCGTKLEIGIAI